MSKKQSEQELWAEWNAPRLRELITSNLWKEKEMWQGRIGSLPFDPENYEKYGRVLLLMGDKIEAGKYLFISGRRAPEYEEAIELYLEKYNRGSWQLLVGTFPKRARNLKYEAFPEAVRAEFMRLKMPKDYGQETLKVLASVQQHSSDRWSLLCCALGCTLALLFFGSCFVVGFYTIFLNH